MTALRFKTCRLLLGNVRKRELTVIQRRILERLRQKKLSFTRRISPRKNVFSYIQLQTTRKLSLFHGDLPITEMQRRTKRASYIPFLLNLERRLDVILVRLRFSETIPQARQPISHRRVCVNNRTVGIPHLKVAQGDRISFLDALRLGKAIRGSFYIDMSVEKMIGKFRENNPVLKNPILMWKSKIAWKQERRKWFRILKTKKGCQLLLQSDFLKKVRSFMKQEEGCEKTMFGYERGCLGSHFDQYNPQQRRLVPAKRSGFTPGRSKKYRFASDWKGGLTPECSHLSNGEGRTLHMRQFWSASYAKLMTTRIRSKRMEIPTHYLEANHRTQKAVVSYGPNIDHIPHNIRLKDTNLLLRSGRGRGQNI